MNKTLIASVVAIATFAGVGTASAAVMATSNVTLQTTITAASSTTVTATPAAENVSMDDIQKAGTKVASLTIDASGIVNGATGTNVQVVADSSYYDASRHTWLMKSGSNEIQIVPEAGGSTGWSYNGANATKRIDTDTSVSGLNLNFMTKEGNNSPVAGNYTLPLTINVNAW
ncbi:hypothetical protein ACDB75_000939 [Salmonella enterica]